MSTYTNMYRILSKYFYFSFLNNIMNVTKIIKKLLRNSYFHNIDVYRHAVVPSIENRDVFGKN